jgi:hypothetical protein
MRLTRRRFLRTTGVAGVWLAAGRAHSVSTFVDGQHPVAKEKNAASATSSSRSAR